MNVCDDSLPQTDRCTQKNRFSAALVNLKGETADFSPRKFIALFSLLTFGIIALFSSLPILAREPNPPPPSWPPVWLVVQNYGQTETTIPIAWEEVSTADYYIVSYKTTAEKNYTTVKRVEHTTSTSTSRNISTTIEGLTPKTSYNIIIVACNSGGCSGYRNISSNSVTTKSGPAPAAPTAAPTAAPGGAAAVAPTSAIPGLQDLYAFSNSKIPQFKKLSDIVSRLINIAFYVAIFLAFYFLVWGAFQYIMAGGKKEELGKARARITWAIIGLIIILLSYSIAKFASEIFKPNIGGVPF